MQMNKKYYAIIAAFLVLLILGLWQGEQMVVYYDSRFV